MNSPGIRRHGIAVFALAFLLAFATQDVPALHAAERSISIWPSSPLALARHFESLTEGGPFNPARAQAIDRCRALQSRGAHIPAHPATSPDHDLW